MTKTKNIFLKGTAASLLAFVLASHPAAAFQPDAPFLASQEKNKDKWAVEDKQIKEKLAALERKFGKRPNIIYILADDVGWGEMGWQGGGKHRGTPTPELDKLAFQGMRFWNQRVFSRRDLEKVQRIRGLMDDLGVNLAGVEVMLKLLSRLEASELEVARLQRENEELKSRVQAGR